MSGTYFQVEVRYPGELLDIKELVQPESYAVKMALAKIYDNTKTLEQNIWSCWDFICHEIDYPPAGDYHCREAFPSQGLFAKSLVSQSTWDFWSFPFETLSLGIGDCEDASILLCSMLRNLLSATEVDVTVGYYSTPNPSMGHAWVTIDRMGQKYVLETTLNKALASISQVVEAPPYLAYHKFNDMLYKEVQPGFILGAKNKDAKHQLMQGQYTGLRT